MTKVLLVNPPFYRLLNSHYNANSLGIAYVASYLNSRGYNAWLYNADFLNMNSYLKQKNIFEGFDGYKKIFQDENHEIWEEVVNKIIELHQSSKGDYSNTIWSILVLQNWLKKRNFLN